MYYEFFLSILSRAGYPEKIIRMLQLLHDDMCVSDEANENTTELFRVKAGVEQGCVIAPTLFFTSRAAVTQILKDILPPGL